MRGRERQGREGGGGAQYIIGERIVYINEIEKHRSVEKRVRNNMRGIFSRLVASDIIGVILS